MLLYMWYGETTLDGDFLLTIFESSLRRLLPSIVFFKMRGANKVVQLSFKENRDFLTAVRSASGVNIPLAVGWMFDTPRSSNHLPSCLLEFSLLNNGLDVRLVFFLLEVLEIKLAEEVIPVNLYKGEKDFLEKIRLSVDGA